uniref:carboxypeptidase-like regulatory domain-containing protein n=1 Tax=Parabacteroides merdae TaxID=46503 RepID=UPI003FEE1949
MYRKHVGRALILALMLSGATSMNAQRITRQFKNVPLKTVLAEVEKELQYSIIYKKDEVNERKQITRDFKDASLEEILSVILDKELTYSVQGKMIIISKKVEGTVSSPRQQKQIIVKGVVKDEKGEPIVGANVVEKGTSNGTITDMDGKFSLSIFEGSQLSITYIGYLDQNVTVGKGKTVLNIQLREDTQALEEVVVVGYGTMKKSDLTGSISTISAKDFNKGISSTPDQLLSGKIPGLMVNRSSGDPNSSATMQLRGPSSLTASTAPFYVIDGVPGASIDLVSPDDIESMNVLKDASATAIYGSRAANGVIMVTTRKGRTGKPQVHIVDMLLSKVYRVG